MFNKLNIKIILIGVLEKTAQFGNRSVINSVGDRNAHVCVSLFSIITRNSAAKSYVYCICIPDLTVSLLNSNYINNKINLS